MEINRRALIAGLLSSGFARAASPQDGLAVSDTRAPRHEPQRFVAARRLSGGRFEGAVFDTSGTDIATVPLPSRGHDATVRPDTGECVIFARRPGTFAIAFNRSAGRPPITFQAAHNRHFYGHGVFSPDGRLLFTTENDFANERGVIGIRDGTNDYRLVGEFPSYGVGPHDLALLSDGRTLVIANGGILTHPEEGRRMLNLPSMQPNLVYLDTLTGALLERHALSDELHQLSLRHLSVTPTDEVVFGCQFVGSKSLVPMLVGTHWRQKPITLIEAPSTTYNRLRNYVSSIVTDRSGRYVIATSAKGSAALMFDLEKRLVVREYSLPDVSGVARGSNGNSFVMSTGVGATYNVSADDERPERMTNEAFAWDNHLTALS